MSEHDDDELREFEEEFDFETEEEAPHLEEEHSELGVPAAKKEERPATAMGGEKKGSKLPWIIGAVIVGFLGWKGYGLFMPKDEGVTGKEEVKAVKGDKAQAKNAPETTVKGNAPAVQVATTTAEKPAMPSAQTTAPASPAQTMQPQAALPQPIAQTTPTQQQILPSAPTMQAQPAQPTASMPAGQPDLFNPQPSAPLPTPDDVAKRFDKVEASTKQSMDRMNGLESRMNELMDSMTNINQGIGQVSKDIGGISETVQKLSKDVKVLKAKAQEEQAANANAEMNQPGVAPMTMNGVKSEPKTTVNSQKEQVGGANSIANQRNEAIANQRNEAFTTPTLVVHAIIPGRAWLKTREGTTITVTEGDTLDRYGKVLVIDAANGVVITSSGVTLR